MSIPSSPNQRPRVLVTGASGFLGRYMTEVLQRDFSVRSLDLTECPAADDSVCGSVSDPAAVASALAGMESVVLGHMAPNRPEIYGSPEIPFDVNVKGTALLLDAAVKQGIKRAVLISSIAAVQTAFNDKEFLTRDLPLSSQGMYSMTKHLQEVIARYYHNVHGLAVAILRPAYICRGDVLVDKYGRERPSVNWQFIDPRDIGLAAAAALKVEGLGCEVFYVVAGPDADAHADVAYTYQRLGWDPQYRFAEFPRD